MLSKEKTGYPSIDRTHLKDIPEEKLHPKLYPMSILATFLNVNEKHLSEPAIFDAYVGKKLKGNVKNDAISFAKALLAHGFSDRDKIAIITPNMYFGIVAIIGANAIGMKVVILDPTLGAVKNSEFINFHDANIAMVFETTKTMARILQAYCPRLRYIIDVEVPESGYSISEEGFSTFDMFMKSGNSFPEDKISEVIEKHSFFEGEMLYLQTSGSTEGKPKTLPFSNKAIFGSLIYASNSTGTKTRDTSVNKVLCIIPYRLPYGFMTIFVNLMGGNQVVLAKGASPEDVSKYYKYAPSYIYGTPAIFKLFMSNTPKSADLSSITAFFCSGFALPEESFEIGRKYFAEHNSNAEIRNNYGIGEGLCIGTASDGIEHIPGTSGKFYLGPEWLIVDNNLHEVKYGEPGELLVCSETLCSGYYQDPERTMESFININEKIWYKTGDFVLLREDGYVVYLGRKKRFFQPKGANDKVNAATIENALRNVPEVADSAVVILTDDEGFDYAKAFVVLHPRPAANDGTREIIFDQIKQSLLDYQLPKDICFIDEIPMMNSGKIDYKKLESLEN